MYTTGVFLFLFFLAIHWLFDFVLQDDKTATEKSTNINVLTAHSLEYGLGMSMASIVVVIPSLGISPHIISVMMFSFIVFFLSHMAIDYVTSKMTSKYYKENKRHLFFTTIGFDQFLHHGFIAVVVNVLQCIL